MNLCHVVVVVVVVVVFFKYITLWMFMVIPVIRISNLESKHIGVCFFVMPV